VNKGNKFNIGQSVLPRDGYSSYSRDSNYGGAGWASPDRLFDFGINSLVISEIGWSKLKGGVCTYFFKGWTNGIFECALVGLDELREDKIDKIINF
jgi:hypothetical protein